MSDYPTIETGTYTWHPIMPSLLTLLREMRGALKMELPVLHPYMAERKAKSKQRRDEFADRIVQMKEEGLSNVKIGKEIGVRHGTVGDWWREIRKERGL